MRLFCFITLNVCISRTSPFIFGDFQPLFNKITLSRTCRRVFHTNSLVMPSNAFDKIIKNPCARVLLVPTLRDNYAYILTDRTSNLSLCVDPAEPEKVLKLANSEGIVLSMVLCTHKHSDHSGGNERIRKLVPDITVVGSSYESVPGVNKPVNDGEILNFGDLEIKCIKASCHTIGHIMYYIYSPGNADLQPILFTGDTIFVGGCGRFFEGNAKMMLDIMYKVKKLPHDTLVYCGHEYTVKNLEFAYGVDTSIDVKDKLEWAKIQRVNNHPTIPSTIGDETKYNPFMRTEKLMANLKESNEESTMMKLRNMKDVF